MQGGGDAALVLGVQIGEQEPHCAGFGAAIAHRGDHRFDIAVIQRPDDFAARADAFGNLEAVFARHQGGRIVGLEVIHLGPDLAADLQQVAKSGRGHQCDMRAFAL